MNYSRVNFGKYTGLVGEKRDEREFIKHQNKKMKYYTTNYFYGGMSDILGSNLHHGFGTPSQEVEKSTSLRGCVTNPKIKHEWGATNLNSGGLATSGPTIRHIIEKDKKSCNNEDSEFYKRHFYTLDKNPNAVQKSPHFRQGVDTRNDTREEYN